MDDDLTTEERVEILRAQIASMAELLDRLWDMLDDVCPASDGRDLYARQCHGCRRDCPRSQ